MKRIKALIQFCAGWVFGPNRSRVAELEALRGENSKLSHKLRWLEQCMAGDQKERDLWRSKAETAAGKHCGAEDRIANLERALKESQKHSATLAKIAFVPFEPRETDSAPAFDQEDSAHLREFLATNTGQRLARLVNWWSQYEEQKATLASARHEYFCGRGAGFRACGAFVLQRLSADTRPQQGEDTQASNGAAGLRERHAP